MKYAIISDIHANIEALQSVLDAIDTTNPDKIICLGDIVGYFANPNECISLLRKREILCIAGNHDRVAAGQKKPTRFGARGLHAIRWTIKKLHDENKTYLRDLPSHAVIDNKFLIVHAAVHPKPNENNYLLTETEVMKSFDELKRQFPGISQCFFGHTHLSCGFIYDDNILSMTKSSRIKVKDSALYLINPGSVGKSHNYKDSRASFMLYDTEKKEISFLKNEYNKALADNKCRENNLNRTATPTFRSRIRSLLRLIRCSS